MNVRQEYIELVEDFECQYGDVDVPYPEDKYSEELAAQYPGVVEEIKNFKDESNKRIAEIQKV